VHLSLADSERREKWGGGRGGGDAREHGKVMFGRSRAKEGKRAHLGKRVQLGKTYCPVVQ
jgi:hypothetical protein